MMKIKALALLILPIAGLAGMNVCAHLGQFSGPSGYMFVYNLDESGGQGSYVFESPWGVSDLKVEQIDDVTFQLFPNQNTYNPSDSFWSDGAGDGNKWMTAISYFERVLDDNETNAVFRFDVDANTLSNRYSVRGFIKLLQPNNALEVEIYTNLNAAGSYDLSYALETELNDFTGWKLQCGWEVNGRNANPAADWGSMTVSITEIAAEDSDSTPPTPIPSFAVGPVAESGFAVSMSSTTVTDDTYDVEYFFENTNTAANSGWISTTNWIDDAGLTPETLYAYRVKARDTSGAQNETAWSPVVTVETLAADPFPPEPNPMQFAGTDVSPITIELTAETAVDGETAVQYLFTCLTDTNLNSTWQGSPVYVATGLTPNSDYTFNVTARDLNGNMTDPSESILVTTLPEPSAGSFSNSFQNLTGDTDDGNTVHTLAKLGLTTGSINPNAVINFSTNGAAFSPGINFAGRDLLKTISTGYESVSFVAYATFTFSGQADLSGYLGLGQGIQTGTGFGEGDNYGVPELNLGGVAGVFGEFKDSTAGGDPNCKILKIFDGNEIEANLTDPILSTETIRAKLVYDAENHTVSVSIDKDYASGPFVEDQVLGSVSTLMSDTNGVYSMFTNAPVRVYVGGGEGTVVKDFEIIADTGGPGTIVGVDDLTIEIISGGSKLLTWTTVAGQTYSVEYRSSLTEGDWAADPAPSNSGIPGNGGSVSATSTVSDAAGFYQIMTE